MCSACSEEAFDADHVEECVLSSFELSTYFALERGFLFHHIFVLIFVLTVSCELRTDLPVEKFVEEKSPSETPLQNPPLKP